MIEDPLRWDAIPEARSSKIVSGISPKVHHRCGCAGLHSLSRGPGILSEIAGNIIREARVR
jgi:hypothetical protein